MKCFSEGQKVGGKGLFKVVLVRTSMGEEG